MIRAVIFDLDGTLLNTLDDIAGSVNATLRHFALPEVSLDKVRRSVGNGGRNLIRCVVPGGESHPQFEEILSYYIPYYEQHCQIETRAYEGILPTLKTLKEMGKKLAIVYILQEPRFNHQLETTYGVLEEECSSMLSSFFKGLRERHRKEKD